MFQFGKRNYCTRWKKCWILEQVEADPLDHALDLRASGDLPLYRYVATYLLIYSAHKSIIIIIVKQLMLNTIQQHNVKHNPNTKHDVVGW